MFRFQLWDVPEVKLERQSQSSELSDSQLRNVEENLQQENLSGTAEQSFEEQLRCQQSPKRRHEDDGVLVVDQHDCPLCRNKSSDEPQYTENGSIVIT